MDKQRIMKVITTLTFLAIGFIFAGGRDDGGATKVGQNIDTTTFEKYEVKVIIDAKWGSGPGEFGVEKEAAGLAPNCYTLDKEGNIYIPDPVNARIQIFDANGKFLREFQYTEKDVRFRYLGWEIYDIAVDNNKNIYILFYINVGSFPGQSVEVRKYNSAGEFVDSFPIPLELLSPTNKEIEVGIPPLLIRERITRIIIENNDIKVEGLFESEKFGGEKKEKRRYTLVKNNQYLSKHSILETKNVITIEEDSIKFPHLGYFGYYFGHYDSIGNCFYFVDQERVGEKNGWDIHQGIIYKYKNGKLIATVKHPFPKWGDLQQLFYDDETQNIYCLTNDDEGVKLLLYRRLK